MRWLSRAGPLLMLFFVVMIAPFAGHLATLVLTEAATSPPALVMDRLRPGPAIEVLPTERMMTTVADSRPNYHLWESATVPTANSALPLLL